jgi:hypothetical protein
LVFFIFFTTPEALTADQIINKEAWTKEELTKSLSAAFSPQTNRRKRKEVLKHLREQLKKYPESDRRAIRIAALRHAVDNSIKQMRLLPENDRKKLINSIQKRAEKSYKKVNEMSNAGKAKVRSRLNTPDGKAAVEEINKVIISKLNAEEQREFAPISKLWVKTLRSL